MEDHLITFKEKKQYLPTKSKKKWLYSDLSDNLFPPSRHGFLQYVYDNAMPLHDYINHVRSSQAYCVNIFFYLLQNFRKEMVDYFNINLNLQIDEIEKFEFEHSPEENILGEWKSEANKPEEYVTAVDLIILGKRHDGTKQAILIEVKFTEASFSECGGYNSGANTEEMRNACKSGKLLVEDFKNCYLHGCKGKSNLKQKYFELLLLSNTYESSAFDGICPFITTHQCLRNHAMMQWFLNAGYDARLCLVHHEDNTAIVEKWEQYNQLLKPSQKSKLYAISGKDLINKVGDEYLKSYYKDRYVLNSSLK